MQVTKNQFVVIPLSQFNIDCLYCNTNSGVIINIISPAEIKLYVYDFQRLMISEM